MPKDKAYLETTILADVLLKPGHQKNRAAIEKLSSYSHSLLPVYAIKELKAGAMRHYAYFHQKLVTTKSLAATIDAINSLVPPYWIYRKNTSLEALSTAVRLSAKRMDIGAKPSADQDAEDADRYRLAIELLLKRAWKRRRHLAKEVVDELDCYTEAPPRLVNGLVDLTPENCEPERECCLAGRLRIAKEKLEKLRDAIPSNSVRVEDVRRRHVLKQLINTPNRPLTREQCRSLGDAIFAFFAPEDADILTTNVRDHAPLAASLGKTVEHP